LQAREPSCAWAWTWKAAGEASWSVQGPQEATAAGRCRPVECQPFRRSKVSRNKRQHTGQHTLIGYAVTFPTLMCGVRSAVAGVTSVIYPRQKARGTYRTPGKGLKRCCPTSAASMSAALRPPQPSAFVVSEALRIAGALALPRSPYSVQHFGTALPVPASTRCTMIPSTFTFHGIFHPSGCPMGLHVSWPRS
jgi:hypothetical protein